MLSDMLAFIIDFLPFPSPGWKRTATLPALLGLALFSKEQGITVVVICLAYEIFCEQQVSRRRVNSLRWLYQVAHVVMVFSWERAPLRGTICMNSSVNVLNMD